MSTECISNFTIAFILFIVWHSMYYVKNINLQMFWFSIFAGLPFHIWNKNSHMTTFPLCDVINVQAYISYSLLCDVYWTVVVYSK